MTNIPSDEGKLDFYCNAIRAMRLGVFDKVVIGPHSHEVDKLGLEISHLSNWLEKRFYEFNKLQDIATEIAGGLFADNVLDKIYDAFSSLIPYDRIGCALLSEDKTYLYSFWAKANYPKMKIGKHFKAEMQGSSLSQVLSSQQPRIINNLHDYLARKPSSVATKLIVAEGVRSSLTCPLIANGKNIGFLFFSSKTTNTYHNEHNAIYQRIAGQVSILIEKSFLYQKLFAVNQQLVNAHKKLEQQAVTDALTGVLNRGGFLERLQGYLSCAGSLAPEIAVIMADVDFFKKINDGFGHLAGDEVLRRVAKAMQDELREGDYLGRYGGEEFIVVLNHTTATQALEIAERLRQKVAMLAVAHATDTLHPTISLGVTVAQPGDDANALIGKADRALYQAKSAGRNQSQMQLH